MGKNGKSKSRYQTERMNGTGSLKYNSSGTQIMVRLSKEVVVARGNVNVATIEVLTLEALLVVLLTVLGGGCTDCRHLLSKGCSEEDDEGKS